MKIYLHVGPHKTGTTSVQQWMLENAKVHFNSYGLYYPEPPEEGPGHALLAWDVLGIHGRKVDPVLLQRVVEDGKRRGAEQIFLSSEEFCMGLAEGTLENLAVLNDFGTVELLVTLTPLADRFLAEVANLILYQHHIDLLALDPKDLCKSRPGLNPDLVQILRCAIRPTKTHVILGQKSQPKVLFQSLSQILGIKEPKFSLHINKRHSDTHTRLLNFLNAELGVIDLAQKHRLAEKMLQVLGDEELGELMKPVSLSDSVREQLNVAWSVQCQQLNSLRLEGEIELYPGP